MKIRLRTDWTAKPIEWDAAVVCRLWSSPEEAAALRRERDEARRETEAVVKLLKSLLDDEGRA